MEKRIKQNKMRLLLRIKQLITEIYADRRLLFDLSTKDMQRRFSGTYFGMVWGILQPLMTMIVYWAVFQFGFRSGDVGQIPYVLWFISGIVVWLYISEAFTYASNSFLEYSYLIQKVKFNVNILPLVKIFSSFYIHLFFLLVVIMICVLFGYCPTLRFLQIVYYMAATVILLFAMSILSASVMVFFRDLNQIISIILLLGMWGTPIAWNLDMFPPAFQRILKLNPFYYLVEGYRDALLGRKWFWDRPRLGIYFWILTFILLTAGVTVYTKLKPHFADTV